MVAKSFVLKSTQNVLFNFVGLICFDIKISVGYELHKEGCWGMSLSSGGEADG